MAPVARSEYRRGFDECPACGARMEQAWAACADDDPECDCDVAWDCPTCGKKWMDACGAHERSYNLARLEREQIGAGRG